MGKAGLVNGKHYTGYVDQVKQLKREKRYKETIDLLWRLVEATERESQDNGLIVPPWYFEQLAIIFRKEKRFDDEISILTRYMSNVELLQGNPVDLSGRLKKAMKLKAKAEP